METYPGAYGSHAPEGGYGYGYGNQGHAPGEAQGQPQGPYAAPAFTFPEEALSAGPAFDAAPAFGDGASDEEEKAWGAFSADEGSATSISPLRGKHRVVKQRGGLARSSTVLGVGVIAAVGAGGIAAAQGKPPVSISVPDAIAEHIPQSVASIPVVGSMVPEEKSSPRDVLASEPLTTAGMTTADLKRGSTDAGEALRARILAQAAAQQQAADDTARRQAEQQAAAKAHAEAEKQQAAAHKKAEEAKKKAAAEAKKKAEAERLAKLAKSYTLPVSSYRITGTFGEPGSMWSSGYHTGLDFAAPTGTPIKSVHGGTVVSAGWAGAYGYRTVVKLDDGEELWYCHQSSMLVSAGQKVTTGEVIGRVGATGNVTGPHLHLEVHTAAGKAMDPRPWLEAHGHTP
ncbi:M23 family metallopeptidase [Streptomyces bomunensis]|uniref:M23 family metallopeptidase n=2 Tax=Streptomyces montanisoli TaxID=2798581 RepID=A0A940MHE3_9ACTN|nr:M23 family metallopeptidase [Streptomyces montanisoli]